MKITQCSDKSAWDAQSESRDHAEFLQSWQWGEFRAATGASPVRLQFTENGQSTDQAQGFVHDLGFGITYLYIPRWNVMQGSEELLRNYAKEKGHAFIRIEPAADVSMTQKNVRRTHTRQPQDEWLVDVRRDRDSLLADMHSKTRYNIRLAEKKGVVVESKKDIEMFWQLNVQTRDRDKFKSHDKAYYQQLLAQDFMQQFTAMYQGKAMATIICAQYGDTMTYVHGASGNEYRNVMAPYLLQWQAMQAAHDTHVRYYSFGGIAPEATQGSTTSFHGFSWEPTHRFTGITRFKVGFGGSVRHYPDAIDIVLRPLHYRLYHAARKLKGYA